MTTSRTTFALALIPPFHPHVSLKHFTGFSLVEVLITTLLISIGLLGMAALQGRALAYSSDAEHRGTAAMLAGDLLELIRATPTRWNGYLDSASPRPPPANHCLATPNEPTAQLACWLAEIDVLLPPLDPAAPGGSHVCRSSAPGTCDNQGPVIEVQVVWQARQGECPSDDPAPLCHYRLRGEI